jgi:hypothetical protein
MARPLPPEHSTLPTAPEPEIGTVMARLCPGHPDFSCLAALGNETTLDAPRQGGA